MTLKRNDPNRTDWKWQLANCCKDLDTLNSWLPSSETSNPNVSEPFAAILDTYQMGITPYYFSLIKTFDNSDPIYRQVVPDVRELQIDSFELEDPISDENPRRGSRPLKALIHRYENRVLLMPTALCAVYCRFCFRKRLVGNTAHNAREDDLQAAYQYIAEHSEIEEVILTGGDPLTLGDPSLQKILRKIAGVPHVRLIRIHTRLPVVNPYRLTPELGEFISKFDKPIWVVTHFNHPTEITPIAKKYILAWIQKGIPFLNQSVLLRGINDSDKILQKLFMGLLEIKVKPYYLHQADRVMGTSHLRVPVEEGLRILNHLRGTISGYAIPHYMLDRPEGLGKIPLETQYADL